MNAEDPGPLLLQLAREAIARQLGLNVPPTRKLPPALEKPGATFVTLTRRGALRGCIGSLEAHLPLADDVANNARSAAFQDPRFPPLSQREWPEIRLEVSLLTPAEPISCQNEAELLQQLQPGRDGLIFAAGTHRATFLPQVWEQLPDPREFLQHLRQKAGLPPDYWSPEVRCWRYRVRQWKEGEKP